MNEIPEVSIILPTYNAASTIKQTIESVFIQTFNDYELIVIDDGSTDNTKEIIEPYLEKVNYIYKINGGVSSARNVGIKASKGKYLAFIDSDDIWMENKLEKQLKYFYEDDSNEIGLVFTDRASFDVDGNLLKKEFENVYSGDIFKHLLITNFITTVTVMLRRSCLDEVGLFDEEKKVSEDWDLWLRIARKYKCIYIDKKLASKGYLPGSLSWDKLNMYRSCIEIQKHHLVNPHILNIDKDETRYLTYGLAYNYRSIGYYYLNKRKLELAKTNLKKSLSYRFHRKTIKLLLLSMIPIFLFTSLKRKTRNKTNG